MKNILIILNPYFSNNGAFDNNNPQVWVFTFNECGQPCDKTLSILEKRVDFIEPAIIMCGASWCGYCKKCVTTLIKMIFNSLNWTPKALQNLNMPHRISTHLYWL